VLKGKCGNTSTLVGDYPGDKARAVTNVKGERTARTNCRKRETRGVGDVIM
jgi:hypothetical protein